MKIEYSTIRYLHFTTIDSTSRWVKDHALSLDHTVFTCVTADEQTAGHGRQMKPWLSPKEKNLYATLFFTVPKECPFLFNLGQIMALSCAQTMIQLGFTPEVKWPNDILIERKKISGILCELIDLPDNLQGRWGVSMGIGVNLNMKEESLKNINQPATSLSQISQHEWEIDDFLKPLLHQVISDIGKANKYGFSMFVPLFNKLLAYRQEIVSCRSNGEEFIGLCKEITSDGKLLIQQSDGTIRSILSGETQGLSSTLN